MFTQTITILMYHKWLDKQLHDYLVCISSESLNRTLDADGGVLALLWGGVLALPWGEAVEVIFCCAARKWVGNLARCVVPTPGPLPGDLSFTVTSRVGSAWPVGLTTMSDGRFSGYWLDSVGTEQAESVDLRGGVDTAAFLWVARKWVGSLALGDFTAPCPFPGNWLLTPTPCVVPNSLVSSAEFWTDPISGERMSRELTLASE